VLLAHCWCPGGSPPDDSHLTCCCHGCALLQGMALRGGARATALPRCGLTAAMHGQCTMPQLRPGALLWSARWARVVWQQRLGSLWKRMLLRCAAL
jgi:hypothetical protein